MTGKRILGWLLSALFCILVLAQTWSWMRRIFTLTSPSPKHHSHSNPAILYAYLAILSTLYGLLLMRTQLIDKMPRKSLFLACRRIWCYQYGGTTLGTTLSLLSLAIIHVILVLWPSIPLEINEQMPVETLFERHRVISDRLAQLGTVNLGLGLGLAVRTSSIWRSIGLVDASASLPWHRWFARLGLLAIVYHGGFQWTKHYYRRHILPDTQRLELGEQGLDAALHTVWSTWWPLTTSSTYYWTGSVMALTLAALVVGSHPLLRQVWYGLFRATHIIAATLFILVGVWHHRIVAFCLVAMGGLWLMDLICRWKAMNEPATIVALVPIAEGIVQLKVQSQTSVLPGQYLYCSFSHGSIWKDLFASHPFSLGLIETRSTEQIMTFYIKAKGRLTRRLYETAGQKEGWPSIRVGRPLGQSHWKEPVIVLVAEGIGITPWLSVIQSTLPHQQVHVIWTVRNTDLIQPLIQDSDHVIWQIHVTGDYQLESQVESLQVADCSAKYNHGRPHYPTLMEAIRLKYPTEDVALGLCLHDDSVCANLARSTKFSHSLAVWHVHSERFDL